MKLLLITSLFLSLILGGCAGVSSDNSKPPDTQIRLAASPASIDVAQGSEATSVITVSPSGMSSVALSASGLPSGVTASFVPATTQTTSTLTIQADSSAAIGTALVTIVGTVGTTTTTTTITLQVSAAPPVEISLTAVPSSLSVAQGSEATSVITVSPSGASSVALSASGLPSGVTASFVPATTQTTSTLTVQANSSAAIGPALVTVVGTVGSRSVTTTVSLQVEATVTPVQMQVLFPPSNPFATDYTAVQTYLMGNPYVSGVVISVDWSDFDIGNVDSGTHTRYDFALPDALIDPWVKAGKTVNLTLQNTTYGGSGCPQSGGGSYGTVGSNCAMPGWMWTALTAAHYTTCSSQQVPNWRAEVFQSNYRSAIAALVNYYSTNTHIGYIRIGLGRGGEINLPQAWQDTTSACGIAYTDTWGYSVGTDSTFTWNAYLQSMVIYEGGQNFNGRTSPKQIMVSITPVSGAPGSWVPDFLAPIAVSLGIGFGNQGLQFSDIGNCPHAGGDWCQLFAQFVGQVPLELQTFGQSCPAGNGQCPNDSFSNKTGSLVPLLPWAVQNHVDILELYYKDWLIAYDPDDPNHVQFGADYTKAIQDAATSR